MNILFLDSKPDAGRMARLQNRLDSLGIGLVAVQTPDEMLRQIVSRGFTVVVLDLEISRVPVAEAVAMIRRFRPKSRVLCQGSEDQWALVGPALNSMGVRRLLKRPWTVGGLLNLLADEMDDDEPMADPMQELESLGKDIEAWQQEEPEDPSRIAQRVKLQPKRTAVPPPPKSKAREAEHAPEAPKAATKPDYPLKRGEKDPYLRIEVSRDGVTGRLVCYPLEDRYHSMDDVREELAKRKIVHGVDYERLEHLIKSVNQTGEPILGEVVAEGKNSVDGQNGRIEWFVATSVRVNLQEDEAGKINYKDVFEIPCVRTGEKIAKVYEPTEPVDGLSIYGKPLIGKRGKSVKVSPAKGSRFNPDDSSYYAEIDGQVQAKGGKLGVIPVWNVTDDVDLSTGNIEFLGSVIIQGNVMAGFSVKAEGDILVKGLVEGAELKAGGTITVKMGVVANGKGMIEAGENFYAKYCSSAIIRVEKDVTVEDTIMNSDVQAGGKVKVSKNKGSIVGGTVAAQGGIDILNAGSDMGQTTTLIVGEQYFVRDRLVTLSKKIQRQQEQIETLKQSMAPFAGFQDNDPRLGEAQRKSLARIKETMREMLSKVTAMERQKDDAAQGLNRMCHARINVRNVAHPNLKMQVGIAHLKTAKSHTFCSFYEDRQAGEVRLGAYEGKIEKKKVITSK